jgi:hypothetical protein
MLLEKGKMLGLTSEQLLAPVGPLPLKDDQGMGIACALLLQTLDKGKIQTLIKF